MRFQVVERGRRVPQLLRDRISTGDRFRKRSAEIVFVSLEQPRRGGELRRVPQLRLRSRRLGVRERLFEDTPGADPLLIVAPSSASRRAR